MTLTNPTPAPAVPPGVPGPHTPPDAVHCTIDGFDVAVPKGTLIIRAAALAIAESWLRIDRISVSSTTASAKVPRTVRIGELGK